MPKEQINYPHWKKIVFHQSGDGDQEVVREIARIDPALFVRWEKGGNVVLGMRTYPDADWADCESAPVWPNSEPKEAIGPFMTRSEINHMIATLRRARDQAFGRDQ